MERMKTTVSTTLEQAKQWLRERLREGAHCPCCGQIAKLYRRRINSTMARALIQLYLHDGSREFVHAPSLPGDTHEMSQLSWWGLIQEEKVLRPDGGRAGFWKLTDLGTLYVRGYGHLAEYALIYDGKLFRLEGEERNIQHALGKKFNFSDLMNGT